MCKKSCVEENTAEFTQKNPEPQFAKKLSKSTWQFPKCCPEQQVAKILIYQKDKCVICVV